MMWEDSTSHGTWWPMVVASVGREPSWSMVITWTANWLQQNNILCHITVIAIWLVLSFVVKIFYIFCINLSNGFNLGQQWVSAQLFASNRGPSSFEFDKVHALLHADLIPQTPTCRPRTTHRIRPSETQILHWILSTCSSGSCLQSSAFREKFLFGHQYHSEGMTFVL